MLPYHGRYPHVKAGTNFLKSLQEMPQFVCTCCHCMLFSKTVTPFNIREYDMNNDIVQKCLSHRGPVHEHAVHQATSQSTVVNINTHTHDPHLDDTEQLHAQQSTDDILQVEGNKAVVMENNTNDDEETDSDLQEEQAALDCKQEMTGDALPSVVQIENLENRIYQCAPGENNIPKYILLDEDFEVLAFPDFFPYGEGGYYSE